MTDERPQDLSLYMRVLENMEEAVIAVDDLERVVLFNPAAQVCCGFSERQALGRHLADLFSDQSELLSMTRTVLETGRSFTQPPRTCCCHAISATLCRWVCPWRPCTACREGWRAPS